jgi:hypothetical protein
MPWLEQAQTKEENNYAFSFIFVNSNLNAAAFATAFANVK